MGQRPSFARWSAVARGKPWKPIRVVDVSFASKCSPNGRPSASVSCSTTFCEFASRKQAKPPESETYRDQAISANVRQTVPLQTCLAMRDPLGYRGCGMRGQWNWVLHSGQDGVTRDLRVVRQSCRRAIYSHCCSDQVGDRQSERGASLVSQFPTGRARRIRTIRGQRVIQ